MQIRTSQGHKVEPVLIREHGDYMRAQVAVNGVLCPEWLIPKRDWEMELTTLPEPEFWQNVADAALSMKDAEVMVRN